MENYRTDNIQNYLYTHKQFIISVLSFSLNAYTYLKNIYFNFFSKNYYIIIFENMLKKNMNFYLKKYFK